MLKPVDLYVTLKLAVSPEGATYTRLAHTLGLSSSQVHRAVKRAQESGLVRAGTTRINGDALLELLVHGVKYVFPASPGAIRRGVPTAHSAAPLREKLSVSGQEFVWPYPEGVVRGESIQPLHGRAPEAAKLDSSLYELLALVDAVRVGRARERELAGKYLKERLGD